MIKESARAVAAPRVGDALMLRRLCRYLRGTPDYVLDLKYDEASDSGEVVVIMDASWGGLRDERGTSGYVLKYRGVVIKTNSRTQSVVALSSAEAEILALAEAVKDAMLLRTILKEIGIDTVITAWSDSTACILSTFRRGLGRLRHMDLRLAWLQDLVREKVLVMRHIPTERNTADVLTKSLPLQRHLRHTTDLGLHNEIAIIDGDEDEPDEDDHRFTVGALEVIICFGVVGFIALLRILWLAGLAIVRRLGVKKPVTKPTSPPERPSMSASSAGGASSSSTSRAAPKSAQMRGKTLHDVWRREGDQKSSTCATCQLPVSVEQRRICDDCHRQIHCRPTCVFCCPYCGGIFCRYCCSKHWCPGMSS
jgi:hypothetical protein